MRFIYLEPANSSVRLMSNLHIAPSNFMIVGGATVTSPNSQDVKLWLAVSWLCPPPPPNCMGGAAAAQC